MFTQSFFCQSVSRWGTPSYHNFSQLNFIVHNSFSSAKWNVTAFPYFTNKLLWIFFSMFYIKHLMNFGFSYNIYVERERYFLQYVLHKAQFACLPKLDDLDNDHLQNWHIQFWIPQSISNQCGMKNSCQITCQISTYFHAIISQFHAWKHIKIRFRSFVIFFLNSGIVDHLMTWHF